VRHSESPPKASLTPASEPVRSFRFAAAEVAGAFGDLGTLIPFVAAYLAVVKLDPAAVLIAFGVPYVAAGLFYRTPFPVQPMKAIGTIAATQPLTAGTLGAATIQAAGLVTAVAWIFLAVTGLASRVAQWTPPQVVVGIVLGLGMSLMLEAVRLMADDWVIGAALLAAALALLERRSFLAMLTLLVVGAGVALWRDPTLAARFAALEVAPRLPSISFGSIGWEELWIGATLLALPQVPLTLGNALIATVEQSNRLFPDRPVTVRQVALSTGLMNFWSAAVGGVPLCHGAGGMAGHVQFGARTGAAPILFGLLLVLGGVLFADAVALFFRSFPASVLGVILFLAGAQLALGMCRLGSAKDERFVVLTTAAVAIWHVGVAFLFGLLLDLALRRGWVRL